MSDDDSHRLAQEEDRINTPTVILIGVISLVVFGVGTVFTYRILKQDNLTIQGGDKSPVSPEIGQHEVGVVHQTLFTRDTTTQRMQASQRQHLGEFGWVDRDKGIAHIPIERAMELLLEPKKP